MLKNQLANLLKGCSQSYLRTLSALFTIFGIILIVNTSWAQKSPLLKKVAKEKVSIVITAQQAEFDNKAHKAIYKDNVKLVRGDVTMYANQLEAFLDQDGKEIDHIVVTGDVKILQENRVITGQKGIYYEKEQKIVLTGNPVSREGKNVVEGSRMTYFFARERIIVEEARTVLYPDNTKKQEKK